MALIKDVYDGLTALLGRIAVKRVRSNISFKPMPKSVAFRWARSARLNSTLGLTGSQRVHNINSQGEVIVSSKFIVAQLNARLQPMHRGEYFEDPLDEELKNAKCGEVSGGGTLQSKIGEVEYCDIEIQIDGDSSIAERVAVETLVRLGAPKGSKLILEYSGREVPFGEDEGMAVYLNGSELPDEVYKTCDSNFVYSEFDRLLHGTGRVLSYWQGPTETAFYMYGKSFQKMRHLLAEFMASYPLCAKARVEKIA